MSKKGGYLRPLCPAHHTVMVLVELWLKVDVDVFPKPCYACLEPGCAYHYDIVSGYFTTREGESIERDIAWWARCPHDGLPIYIAEFEPQKSRRTWQCAQLGCNGSRVTEGPLQASTAAT